MYTSKTIKCLSDNELRFIVGQKLGLHVVKDWPCWRFEDNGCVPEPIWCADGEKPDESEMVKKPDCYDIVFIDDKMPELLPSFVTDARDFDFVHQAIIDNGWSYSELSSQKATLVSIWINDKEIVSHVGNKGHIRTGCEAFVLAAQAVDSWDKAVVCIQCGLPMWGDENYCDRCHSGPYCDRCHMEHLIVHYERILHNTREFMEGIIYSAQETISDIEY